jgi:O-methyltransferase involved in polyketide biosynthesis
MEQTRPADRNFNTISPSAKWLLSMKGHTNIPFASQTAALVESPKKFTPDFDNSDLSFWIMTFHFEIRYWSIDQLLEELPVRNILELSSGFSFRGLDFSQRKEVHYIDTDLPDMVAQKKEFINALKGDSKLKGELELLPLNALDEKKFREVVSHFSPGEIAIVNEGLLMYLDMNEKEKLCKIIRGVLEERGGYWITGDIYLRFKNRNINPGFDQERKEFFEQHRVEENKFETFDEAKEFFNRMGFELDKEAEIDYSTMTAINQLIKYATAEDINKMRKMEKVHAIWRLKLASPKN